jgi:hypothetical protein
MVTREDVNGFLNEFKMKMDIWDIIFLDNRPKNLQTLADLEITSFKRKAIVKELTVQDFSEGPIDEVVFMGTPMWVFGKEIKNKEIYIKISMGPPSKQTLCISFHIAEFPMSYPFKTIK